MQVSSRSIGVSALCGGGRRVGEASKATFSGTGFFDLGLSLQAFCDDRAQGKQTESQKCCGHGGEYTAATKLLNFASALTRPFRIVWTVTILQQAFPCFYRGWSAHDDPQTLQTSKQPGITRGRSPAEGLSKGWRFFPTYAHA
jgi:hypothetical protein